MPRRLLVAILISAGLNILLLLVADIAYFFRDSLEIFPTDEQQGKIKITAFAVAVVLGLAELLVLYFLWRIRETRKTR